MKVSFNELQGMGRKAFIGIGFAEGDAIDAAEMVAWMEAHGLGGVAALKKGLDYLLTEDPSQTPALVYQDADFSVLDAHNHSILGNASLAVELGYARARARGLSITKIRRCHNRVLVIGYLSRLARRGMNVTAFWRNSHEPLIEQVVGFKAGHPVPEICVYSLEDVPDDVEKNDGITLVMANHVDLLPSLRSDYDLTNLMRQTEEDLERQRDRALVEGLDVDDQLWKTLKTLADRLLVEASEASRSGAGAGKSDND
jgi:LDH2 family malate/lactate/ureidoglycolate dehydrogenase